MGFLLTFFRRAESMFFHSEQGTLQRDSWHGIGVTLQRVLADKPSERWWSENAPRFNPTFRAYVETDLIGKRKPAA